MTQYKLFPLAVRGAGTEEVESLSSYLLRLAAFHGVTSTQLIAHLSDFAPRLNLPSYRSLQATPPATLIRANKTTELLVNSLVDANVEAADVLRSTTFLPLGGALKRSMGEFSRYLRWCPACMSEQLKEGTTPYFKLSWLLNDVKACRHHRMLLRMQCRKCSRKQDGMSRWSSLSMCCHCGASLSSIGKKDRIVLDPIGAAPDLLLLIAQMAIRPSATFPVGAVQQYLYQVLARAADNAFEIELFRAVPYEQCLRYASSSEPVTLRTARRIAYYLEVPIYDLLSGAKGTSRSFGFSFKRSTPLSTPLRKSPRARQRDLLRKKLKQWCKQKPRSLAEIARRLGVSTGALRYHCPDISKRLIERRKQYLIEETERKERLARDSVASAMAAWNAEYQGPISRKGLLRVIPWQGGRIPKRVILSTIEAALPLDAA
jgi:DNA-binding CsgD family transcriptional regulator